MSIESDGSVGNNLNLEQALEREAATREILQVISQSRDDEVPVFEAILENACRLCDAPLAYLSMTTDDRSHVISPARRGAFAKFGATLDKLRVPLADSPLALARAINECRVFCEDDISDSAIYTSGEPNRVSMVEDEGARSLMVVPLISNGLGVGSITLYRRKVEPFQDDDVTLVESFAQQAVIAIENVRQFRELQTRLAREAATRKILDVISLNPDDEQPVFDTILESATKLCNAPHGALLLRNSEDTHLVIAAANTENSGVVKMVRANPHSLSDDTSLSVQAVKSMDVRQYRDIEALRDYQSPSEQLRVTWQLERMRTLLYVPLLKGERAIGVLALYRLEVSEFTDDDIELLKTFAAQAVIAIENVRQFKALESLNAELGDRVEAQVGEIERMGKLKRFLPAAVADTVISQGSDKMLSSHRALLGVLFCDIRGFTAFCETAEPEETIEVLQTYHEEMGKLINAHGAGVDHRMGDGIMVLFNDPLPCDDPAGEAVRLAIAMRERMAELSKKWKRLGHRLGFGVGVSLGYATVGMVGFEGRFDYTASGTAINLAARLCDEALDGEILLSPRAGIAVEDDFEIESRGEVSLKGIREPVEIFKLAGAVVA
ncbi:MAG: adenylate/guanylate cyclase domain-containing protein [Pseudomonadota bacterium]